MQRQAGRCEEDSCANRDSPVCCWPQRALAVLAAIIFVLEFAFRLKRAHRRFDKVKRISSMAKHHEVIATNHKWPDWDDIESLILRR